MGEFEAVTEGMLTTATVWGGLPRRVKIGAGWWTFQFEEGLKEDNGVGLFGQTRNVMQEIFLDPQQSYCQARDTVLHEIMHAIASNTILYSHSNRKVRAALTDDEGIARTYTPWLLQVIQDNPQLIEWLQQGEEEAHE